MSSSFGKIFQIHTYGESHGPALGAVIEGCPAGISINEEAIALQLQRRKPGQSKIVTQRKESESFEILSGVFEGKSTGTPISLMVRNENQRSKDYDHIKDLYRPSHADFTYSEKYGKETRDYRGGGRSSARETVARVLAGSIANQFLKHVSAIEVYSYVSSVGSIELDQPYQSLDLTQIDSNAVRCPDSDTAEKMYELIDSVRKNGDTIGGTITCVIKNVPTGLGQPVFDKLHAELGKAMLSINAAKGFEYGSGFEGTKMLGSEHNDAFTTNSSGQITTKSNFSGGIQGGISNGADIYFKVAFKPVATIMRDQDSVDSEGQSAVVTGKGRHDPCVLPRAVPIVDAMANLVMADMFLQDRHSRL